MIESSSSRKTLSGKAPFIVLQHQHAVTLLFKSYAPRFRPLCEVVDNQKEGFVCTSCSRRTRTRHDRSIGSSSCRARIKLRVAEIGLFNVCSASVRG